MVSITFQSAQGDLQQIEAEAGLSLMAAAKANGVDEILAECGGSMVCGTCHCYIAEPWYSQLAPPGDMEREMLDYALHSQANSRLSCQIVIDDAMDGIKILTPPAQR